MLSVHPHFVLPRCKSVTLHPASHSITFKVCRNKGPSQGWSLTMCFLLQHTVRAHKGAMDQAGDV